MFRDENEKPITSNYLYTCFKYNRYNMLTLLKNKCGIDIDEDLSPTVKNIDFFEEEETLYEMEIIQPCKYTYYIQY